ncbi:hypothetical protein ABTE72_19395, partial [Acinetobacter baumannii]
RKRSSASRTRQAFRACLIDQTVAARSNLIQVTPVLGVGPIERSIAFYRAVLGFTLSGQGGG